MGRALAVIAFGALACTTSPPAPEPIPIAPADARAPEPDEPDEPDEPVPEAPRPAHQCSPEDPDQPGGALCSLCSPGREVLLRVVMADTLRKPEGASVIVQSAPPKQPRDLTYVVLADDQRLVAQVFTCPGCRRAMGWGVEVTFEQLRALDDANRRALQKSLGFAETPLLGSASEWRAAKPLEPPRAKPDLPGCAAARD